jgi:glycosyltransferase involved in cell wall biosynthesis
VNSIALSEIEVPGLSPRWKRERSTLPRIPGRGPNLYVAGFGDPNDSATYSGTAFHLLAAGKRIGLFEAGLPTRNVGLSWYPGRILWNIGQVLTGDRAGGYQCSDWFLESLYRPYMSKLRGHALFSFSQLLPTSIVEARDIEKWFFIDMTYKQLLEHYGAHSWGNRIARDMVLREEKGYRAARMVIANSKWAAESLLAEYKIEPSRVAIVPQAANISPEVYRRWEMDTAVAGSRVRKEDQRLRCVFVGKYWKRKGLDRLIRAFGLARRRGFGGTLRIIGVAREELPSELRAVDGIEWIGFLDKKVSEVAFVRCVSECDIGCLLSRAEAGGVALREYSALGLIVLGTAAGGASDQTFPETSIIVPVEADDEFVAGKLLCLQNDVGGYTRMKTAAWQKKHEALWDHAVEKVARLWSEAHPDWKPYQVN